MSSRIDQARIQARVHSGLAGLAGAWDRLHGSSNPFIAGSFLAALEQHGAVSNRLGWQPFHIALEHEGELIAAAPGYLTSHSFGDFVYDWSWAEYAARHGYEWYPKWVIEVPYSPVTGPRLLSRDNDAGIRDLLIQAIRSTAEREQFACVQINYCTAAETDRLAASGFLINRDLQYHWRHRGERNFDGFLARLRSKRRKAIRRERRKLRSEGIMHRWRSGAEASDTELAFAHRCYRKTFREKGNYPALSHACLGAMARGLGERFLLCIAEHEPDHPVACAIFLRSASRLYGRYWGALVDVDCLHFETCYYQAIEYCIAHRLQVFEPGAGGVYKYLRGFEPAIIYTSHWFREPDLRELISGMIGAEQTLLRANRELYARHTPFRRRP